MRQEGLDLVFSKRERRNYGAPERVPVISRDQIELLLLEADVRRGELLEYADGVPAGADVNLTRQSYFNKATDLSVFMSELSSYVPPIDVVDAAASLHE